MILNLNNYNILNNKNNNLLFEIKSSVGKSISFMTINEYREFVDI